MYTVCVGYHILNVVHSTLYVSDNDLQYVTALKSKCKHCPNDEVINTSS